MSKDALLRPAAMPSKYLDKGNGKDNKFERIVVKVIQRATPEPTQPGIPDRPSFFAVVDCSSSAWLLRFIISPSPLSPVTHSTLTALVS